MSGSLDKIARLSIDIQPRVLATMGMRELDSFYAAAGRGGQKQALAAKAVADARIRESERATRALLAANDQVVRSNKALALAQIRQDEAAASGRIAGYRRSTIEVQSLNDKLALSNKKLADAQIYQAERVAAAQKAQARATTVSRFSTAGAIAGTAGSAFLGAGFAGAAVGGYTIDQAVKWQQFTAQNRANAPMSTSELNTYRRLALNIGAKDGANPNDIFLALRYGAEASLSGPALRRYLNASIALGLPTGGSAAIGGAQQALITVGKNFPSYAQNPNAIANMLMSTVQHSARGINVSDLVGALPRLLVMAGHIGGPQALPDSLAMYAALSQAGIPADVIATQGENFLKVLMTGAARKGTLTYKTLSALQKQDGINLFSDFSQKGLQQKGIAGVIGDIKNANLSQATLLNLFPNMRGLLAAMGLTGNQYMTYQRAAGDITKAPQQNPIAKNMQQYLGLDATKLKIIEEQLHVLAITTGTQLLPVFNDLLKHDIVPGVKDFDAFVRSNEGLIRSFVELAPKLIVIGGGLKLIAGGLSMAAKIDELKLAFTKFGNVLTFLGAGPGGGEMGLTTAGMGNMKRAAGEALAPTGDLAVATSTLGKDAAISDVLNATATGEEAVGAQAALATPEVAALGGALAKTDAALVGAAAGGVGGGLLGSIAKLTALLAKVNPFLLAFGGSLAVGHVLQTTPLVTRKIDGQVFGLDMQNGNWYPAKSGPGGSEVIVNNGHKYRPVGPTYNPTGMQVQVNGKWLPVNLVPPSQGGTAGMPGSPSTRGNWNSAAGGVISNLPRWLPGTGGVPFSGSVFGSYQNPQNNYQNRNIATEWNPKLNSGYSEGTQQSDARRVQWYMKTVFKGTKGPYLDTDFVQKKAGSQPIHLPGSSKDIWTFLKYIKDPTNSASNGGYGALWQDPMGNLVFFWHMNPDKMTLKSGQRFPGGSAPMWSWEENGIWHVCVVSTPQSRKDLVTLANPGFDKSYDQWVVGQGGKSKSSGLSLPAKEAGWSGAFATAGTQRHVDPALLAAIGNWEGGTKGWAEKGIGAVNSLGYGIMGVPAKLYGQGAAGQIAGAAKSVRDLLNYVASNPSLVRKHKAAADAVLRRLGIKQPTANMEALVVALAIYAVGPHGDIDGQGMVDAERKLRTAMQINHGAFPATYYTGQGVTRVPTNPGGTGGTGGTNSVNLSTGAGTSTRASAADAQSALSAILRGHTNRDGSVNFASLSPADRTAADALIRIIGYGNLGPLGNSLNNLVASGKLSKGTADSIYAAAQRADSSSQNHPENWYNQAHSKSPKTPAQWSSYWSGRASKDRANLARLLKPYIDPTTGKVNWSKVPTNVRHAADHLIQQIGGEDYMSTRGDLNANVANASVRGTLISAAWSGPQGRMASYNHPEAWWDAVTGTKSSASGATAGASAWHIIGKNCEAATHALEPAKKTAHNTHQIHIVSAGILQTAKDIHSQLVTLNGNMSKMLGGTRHRTHPKNSGLSAPSSPGRP